MKSGLLWPFRTSLLHVSHLRFDGSVQIAGWTWNQTAPKEQAGHACMHRTGVPPALGCCLQELKDKHHEVMQELLMDILRALSAPNMDIRKKTLDIALDLINARNIDEARPPSGLPREMQHPARAYVGQRDYAFVPL